MIQLSYKCDILFLLLLQFEAVICQWNEIKRIKFPNCVILFPTSKIQNSFDSTIEK